MGHDQRPSRSDSGSRLHPTLLRRAIFSSFAEKTIAFRFGPMVFGVAFSMTLAMGVFGGLFPAIRAVKLDVIRALREA